ncbi:MAG: helix-turn-helix transcriptional regulator [Athalassotoga sp.]|uniref:helix-turn-helix transcriptional regulator n=1 Tax=Athalassotoga sp. TaxID=2022597 RepID=UPI003D09499F
MNKGKVKLYSFDNEKERVLKNHPEIRDIYDSLELKYKFIEALIEYRMKNHLTQRELAEKIGLTQQKISQIESGKVNPRIDLVSKIISKLGMEVTVNTQL